MQRCRAWGSARCCRIEGHSGDHMLQDRKGAITYRWWETPQGMELDRDIGRLADGFNTRDMADKAVFAPEEPPRCESWRRMARPHTTKGDPWPNSFNAPSVARLG